jgi:hypothetical protein
MTDVSFQSPLNRTGADREQRIRERAYQLWEADGAPEGKAEHYWHRARELIDAEETPNLSIEKQNDLA